MTFSVGSFPLPPAEDVAGTAWHSTANKWSARLELDAAARETAIRDSDVTVEDAPVVRFVESAAGPGLAALSAAMVDYGVPPINLDRTLPGRLGRAYCEVLDTVRHAVSELGAHQQSNLRQDLPWHLEEGDLALGLVEVAAEERSLKADATLFGVGAPDSRVYAKHPALWAALDKDGLVDCTRRDARQTVLVQDGDAIHYHEFLRRHFTSGMNRALIQRLLDVGRQPGNVVRIALDHRRLMPAQDISNYAEKDYWHGPQLSADWLDDPHAVGKTVHACVDGGPGRDYPRFFAYWRMDSEGNKVVQMEELSEHHSAQQGDVRLLRYLHAIRDVNTGTFVHCDGAVRAYDSAGYEERASQQMPPKVKAAHYRKLFRIDGRINTDDWTHVVGLWFRHNRLATEYLSAFEAPDDAGE